MMKINTKVTGAKKYIYDLYTDDDTTKKLIYTRA